MKMTEPKITRQMRSVCPLLLLLASMGYVQGPVAEPTCGTHEHSHLSRPGERYLKGNAQETYPTSDTPVAGLMMLLMSDRRT